MARSWSRCCMWKYARFVFILHCLRATSLFEATPGSHGALLVVAFHTVSRGPAGMPQASPRLGRPGHATSLRYPSNPVVSSRLPGVLRPCAFLVPLALPVTTLTSSALHERKCDLTGRRQNSKCMSVSKSGQRTHSPQGVNLHTKVYWWPEGRTNVRVRIAARTMKTIARKGISCVARENGVNLNAFRISTKTPAQLFSNISAHHRERNRIAKDGAAASSSGALDVQGGRWMASSTASPAMATKGEASTDLLPHLDPGLIAQITDAPENGGGRARETEAEAGRYDDGDGSTAATPPRTPRKKASNRSERKESSVGGGTGGGKTSSHKKSTGNKSGASGGKSKSKQK